MSDRWGLIPISEHKAALAKARKEGREELAMQVLQYLDGLHTNESVARKELRQAAIDSLTKEGDSNGG